MKLKSIIFTVTNIICSLLIFLILLISSEYVYSNTVTFILLFSSIMLSVFCILSLGFKKSAISKTLFLLNILLTIVFVVYHILNINNMLYVFKSVSNFRSFILSTGNKGVLIYILIQMAQVVFLPIPASIIAVAGALIYGPLLGSLYCTIGVLLGSYFSFYLGRTLGFKLVVWVAGQDNAVKYSKMLTNSGKAFLGVAFLLPMFPDDILCLISGITTMKFKYFFIITTIFRPIGVICMCFFGGGYVIPFSGWGIPIWIIIGILMTIIVIFTYKNQARMEQWVVERFSKRKRHLK